MNNLTECKKLQTTVWKLSGELCKEDWNRSEKLLEYKCDVTGPPSDEI
jgi:hypothetical protein